MLEHVADRQAQSAVWLDSFFRELRLEPRLELVENWLALLLVEIQPLFGGELLFTSGGIGAVHLLMMGQRATWTFRGELEGAVFGPLKDLQAFKCFFVHPRTAHDGVAEWSRFRARFLHARVKVTASQAFRAGKPFSIHGELYGPLRDQALFERVRIDPEAHTLVWPNGPTLTCDSVSVARARPRTASAGEIVGCVREESVRLWTESVRCRSSMRFCDATPGERCSNGSCTPRCIASSDPM